MTEAEIDPIDVLDALGVTGTTAVTKVAGGWDTLVWRVERASDCFALRLFRAHEEEIRRREVHAMQAAGAPPRSGGPGGIPVPTVHAEGVWRDRPALLLSWCPGRPLAHELRARPWRAWRLGVAFGRTLALLHRVDPPAEIGRQNDAWVTWSGPIDAALEAHLRAVSRKPGLLLHLDYHPMNVLTDGHEITGVLDWTNTHPGDPRADLARSLSILRQAPMGVSGVTTRLKAIACLRTLEWGCGSGYRRAAGPVHGMAPFHAWAWAMMALDLAPKVGQPGIWLQPRHLEAMRRRSALWQRRAGLTEGGTAPNGAGAASS